MEDERLRRFPQASFYEHVTSKFSGTHGDREIFIFPVQLITSRIGNLTRLIHTLLYVMTIHTYTHTMYYYRAMHMILHT